VRSQLSVRPAAESDGEIFHLPEVDRPGRLHVAASALRGLVAEL
jgi:hypothetical protein